MLKAGVIVPYKCCRSARTTASWAARLILAAVAGAGEIKIHGVFAGAQHQAAAIINDWIAGRVGFRTGCIVEL